MAEIVPGKPVSTKAPPATAHEEARVKDLNSRKHKATLDRNKHQSRISDCYRFCMPWRHRFGDTQPAAAIDDLFDSTGMTVLEDFAADMLDTFTPRKNNWLEEGPTETLDFADRRRIEGMLKQRQTIVFAEMGASNLYQALQEAYLDLGPGTMALLVTDIGPTQPIHCECIPAPDLLITRGPYGLVDGIMRTKRYTREDVKVLWPDAEMGKLDPEPEDPQNQDLEVTDACWRDWSDKGDEKYVYIVECRSRILYEKEWKGPGSCPFIVARWSRDSTTAWGVGPTYREVPNLRTLDQLRYLDLKNYGKYVDPPTSYEDDGVMNLDNGIQPGDWIPRAPGSKPPEPIESKAQFDVAVFERDELRSAIRRAHYQDRPEQIGKTPPTATQWADERAERARRMGTPATNLVQELQYPLYRRFVHLLDQRGVLPRITLDGRVVSLQPVSPLLRAQEQEELIRNDRFAELIGARFGPQMAMIVIDVIKYAQRQAKLLGVDPDFLRDEAKMAAAIEQLMPILQSTGAVGGTNPEEIAAGLVAGAAAA